MRNLWTAFYMSLTMFTAFPLPRGRWEEALRKLSIACFPVVGLVLGFLWWGLSELGRSLLPGYLAAALVAALPWLFTGFIHLDGFMDVSDAMLSWRDRESRLKILKDVHVGAFAVVMLGLLMMFQFAACLSVKELTALVLIPVLSRCGSAVCVLCLRPLGHSEYATAVPTSAHWLVAVCLQGVLAVTALAIFCGGWGVAVGAAVLAGYAASMACCVRVFGGFSGDMAGFALTVSELCGLLALSLR